LKDCFENVTIACICNPHEEGEEVMRHSLDSSIQEVVNEAFGENASIPLSHIPPQTDLPISWHKNTRKAQELLEENERRKNLCKAFTIEAAAIEAQRDLRKHA
jgi:hypothetical protein